MSQLGGATGLLSAFSGGGGGGGYQSAVSQHSDNHSVNVVGADSNLSLGTILQAMGGSSSNTNGGFAEMFQGGSVNYTGLRRAPDWRPFLVLGGVALLVLVILHRT